MSRSFRKQILEFVFMRSPGVALIRMTSIVMNLAFVSLVTRLAGVTSAGKFFSSYAAILIVSSLSRLGAEQYLVALLPRLADTEKRQRIAAMLAAIATMTGVLVILSSVVLPFTGLDVFGDTWLTFAVFWLATFSLSLNWSNVGAIRGLGRHLASVSLETLVYLALFVLGLLVLNSFQSPTQMQLSLLLAGSIGVSSLLGCLLVVRIGGRLPRPTKAAIGASVKASKALWLASALGVANAWMPILLLGQLAASEEVSVYTLSHRLAAVLLFGLMILNARYAYDYARLMSTNAVPDLMALYRRNTYAQLPFVVIAAVALGVFAPYIIEFSRVAHQDAYPILVMLVLGTFANAVCGPIVTASVTTGNAGIISTSIAGTLAVSMVVVIALGSQMNGLLLAQIVAVTMATQNIVMYFWWTSRMNKKAAG